MSVAGVSPGKVYIEGGRKGFWSLIATMFEGALCDNLYEYTMVFFLAVLAMDPVTHAPDERQTAMVTHFANVVFGLPFVLFPGIFGALSDRYSKKQVIVWSRFLECSIMAFALVAFALRVPVMLWVALLAMSLKSAMLSPAKYGILPELLSEGRLAWGNGVMQMATMVAIIAGTALAGDLFKFSQDRLYMAGGILLGISALGLIVSSLITRPPAANPTERIPANPWAGMGQAFKTIAADRLLFVTVVGYTYFWFAGALLRANIIPFGQTLHFDEAMTSKMMGCLALGIGLGSLSAGFLSRGRIELGLVPFGLGGLVAFALLLASWASSFVCVLFLFFLLGASAGFFDVPLAATLQHRSPAESRGSIISASNMLTFLGVEAAGGLGWLLSFNGMTTRGVFVLSSVFSLGIGVYMFLRVPDFVTRSLLCLRGRASSCGTASS